MPAIPKPARIRDKRAIEAARKPFCEICGRWGTVDVHHIDSRGAGHGDEPENLISLCWVCHRKVHDGNISRDELRRIKAR
jgi:5-methylcytosine-specific restriction endonuclease McrA